MITKIEQAVRMTAKTMLHSGQAITTKERPGRAFGKPVTYTIGEHAQVELPVLQAMLIRRLITSTIRESTVGGYSLRVTYHLTSAGRELAFTKFDR